MFTHDEKNPRPSGNSTEGDGNYVAAGTSPQPNVLDEWPQARWDDYMTGYQAGYCDGIDRGRQHERDEVEAIGREAARIVHAMAKIPPRDHDEDRRRADKRDAYWAERRGEGRTA